MFWVQVGFCFLLWIGYAIQSRKLVPMMRARLRTMSRPQKVTRGAMAIVLSLAVLFGGLITLAQAGGMQEGRLAWWAVPLVAIIGLGFIHFQALATASMLSVLTEGQPRKGPRPETTSGKDSSKSPRQAHE